MPPQTIAARLAEAAAHSSALRPDRVKELCRAILAESPDCAEAWFLLGVNAPDTHSAADMLGRAAALDPAIAKYHAYWGEALRGLGRLDQAVAALAQALALRPDYGRTRCQLAWALFGLKRTDEAIAALGDDQSEPCRLFRQALDALRHGEVAAIGPRLEALMARGLTDNPVCWALAEAVVAQGWGAVAPIPAERAKGLYFVVVVFGPRFVDFFLDYSLATQLAPGNLPGLAPGAIAVYRIHTTTDDAERMRRHPAFQRLCAIAPVELVVFDGDDAMPARLARIHGFIYRAISVLHFQILAEARRHAGAAVVVLPPDILFADGDFTYLEAQWRAGVVAVMAPGPRVAQEPVIRALDGLRDESQALTLPPRRLVELSLQHFHPTTAAMEWRDGGLRTGFPIAFFWRLGDEAYVTRSAHLHPWLLRPDGLATSFAEDTIDKSHCTVDGDLLACLEHSAETLVVVTDSDRFVCFECSPEDDKSGLIGERPMSLEEIARWYDRAIGPLHRSFLAERIVIHSRGLDSATRHAEAMRQSDAVVAAVLRL